MSERAMTRVFERLCEIMNGGLIECIEIEPEYLITPTRQIDFQVNFKEGYVFHPDDEPATRIDYEHWERRFAGSFLTPQLMLIKIGCVQETDGDIITRFNIFISGSKFVVSNSDSKKPYCAVMEEGSAGDLWRFIKQDLVQGEKVEFDEVDLQYPDLYFMERQ